MNKDTSRWYNNKDKLCIETIILRTKEYYYSSQDVVGISEGFAGVPHARHGSRIALTAEAEGKSFLPPLTEP